jgi:hypothetical protein
LSTDNYHDEWLKFVRDVLNVPVGRSKQDLFAFRDIAAREFPTLVPIIDDYLELSSRSNTSVPAVKNRAPRQARPAQKHLFDLLREKTFFPRNVDLGRFAARILPDLNTARFEKLSRSEIAAKIIDYIEERDPNAQTTLEKSMRDALAELNKNPNKQNERESFLSKWERIIKGEVE